MGIEHLTQTIIEYRYWVLIPLSFVEGPLIAFVGGTLAFLGYLNPFVAFAIFFLRDVILDGFFYFLGRFGGRTALAKRILKKIGVNEGHLDDVRRLWHHHGFRTMFFSKLSYGLSAAFLLVAGIIDFDYKKFFWYAALVALAQYGVLFILGYFFGNTLGATANILDILQYVIAGGVIAATAYYIFSRWMRGRLIEQEKHPD